MIKDACPSYYIPWKTNRSHPRTWCQVSWLYFWPCMVPFRCGASRTI